MSQGNLEPVRRAPDPVDPAVRIGHVHLRTSDIDRIRAFYVDLLGFDVIAEARDVPGVRVAGVRHGQQDGELVVGQLLPAVRGEDLLRTIPISIPANASGSLAVTVSDGQRLTQSEQRETRVSQPRSVPQLVRSLNKTRRNDTLYVKLLGAESGAVVNGEVLPSLPPSVLAVLEADRSGGSFNPLGNATLGEWQLATEHAITGFRTLTIQVSPN